MAVDNAARKPRENSSKETLATRRSPTRNGLAPAYFPTPRYAGPPGSGCAQRRQQPAPTRSPGRRLQPQKRFHCSGPYAPVARGDRAARSGLVFPGLRQTAPILAPHS